MKGEVIKCMTCGWEHFEFDVESGIPSGLFGSFSDPNGLSRVLHQQRRERLETALKTHVATSHNPEAK